MVLHLQKRKITTGLQHHFKMKLYNNENTSKTMVGVTAPLNSNVHTKQYQEGSVYLRANSKHNQERQQQLKKQRSIKTVDRDFEWFDLDSIRESSLVHHPYNHESAMIIGHDYNAGLIFTTESQYYQTKAYANRDAEHSHQSNDSHLILSSLLSSSLSLSYSLSSSETNDDDDSIDIVPNDNDLSSIDFEFDSFPRTKDNDNDDEEKDERPLEKDDQMFLERILEVENEVRNSCNNDKEHKNKNNDRLPSILLSPAKILTPKKKKKKKLTLQKTETTTMNSSFFLDDDDQCMMDDSLQMSLSYFHHRNGIGEIDEDEDDDDDGFSLFRFGTTK